MAKMESETGWKYSDFDENYYAMVIANPHIDGMNINPICTWPLSDNGRIYFEPKDKNLKDAEFLDFLINNHDLYVSERIKKELDDFLPTRADAREYKGPMFFDRALYFKTEKTFEPYYQMYIPRYKFIEKKYLPGIDEQHDATTGLEKITNIVLKPSAIKKVPEELRSVFEMDFHSTGWRFCLENIKEKIEAAGATGIKCVKSKDMDWSYKNK
jgi:hypothetical protein